VLLALFLSVFSGGCSHSPAIAPEVLYRDAVLKINSGDLPSAFVAAGTGRKLAARRSLTWNWKFRLIQAEVRLWQGRWDESLALVSPDPPAGTLPADISVQVHLVQGRALYNLHNRDAQSHLIAAEKLAAAAAPEFLGEVYLAMGGMYYSDEPAKAQQYFEKALKLATSLSQPLLEAKARGSLGRLFTRLSRYDQARDLDRASLDLSQAIQAHHVEAVVLLNQGWNYVELGDFEQAKPLFADAQKLAAKAGMKQIEENALNNLGRIYLNQDYYREANDKFSEALAMARNRGDKLSTASYLDNLALSAVGLGALDKADRFNQEALKIQRREHNRVAEIISVLTTARIADARKDYAAAKPLLDAVISDKDAPVSVQWEAENELASLYVANGQTELAGTEFQKVLEALNRMRNTIIDDQYRLAFSYWTSRFYSDYIRFLIRQQRAEKALQVAEFMRARTLREGLGKGSDQLPVEIKAVQKSLAERNKIILSYWLAPEGSFLWVVTPLKFEIYTLPGKKEIEDKVEKYQKTLTSMSMVEPGDENGAALYRMLVEPAAKLIPRGAQVVVIPDGELDKLNFETLLGPSGFWIRDVQLQDASSIVLFLGSKSIRKGAKTLLLIGDPVQADPVYPRLENARQEIAQISAIFSSPSTVRISGSKASPSAYQSQRPEDFDVIHFATHGYASEKSPLDSAIILSPQADGAFKLYAREIVNVRLKARVVVISACYGAGKRAYSAEGLVGLAWAFMKAGAHQVVAGLWDVDDESTPLLLKDFYREWRRSNDTAAALRLAKLKMLKNSSDKKHQRAYYWASLQLYTGS
jgi:CHAT domain-containing protein/Tfp pilus assembly protein PilF